ncbi:MAG: MoaD/ThiS family protein [Christensenellales bacterium]|jgi:molybdopterin converting factor small subunit|nr:MoaD/ThiS family protein [Clostridiales bacterium]
MIKVKFYGLLRLKIGMESMEVEADSVRGLLYAMEKQLEGLTYKDLKQSVIFINGKNITDLKMYRTKLKDGDNVIFMSPVSGG